MVRVRSFPLQPSLRPPPVRRLQESTLGTVETQVLATFVLVVAVAIGLGAVSRLRTAIESRVGAIFGELVATVAIGAVVAASVYALAVIWQVTFVLEYTLGTMAIDRWLAAQQLVTGGIVVVAYLSIRFVNRSIDKLAETRALTNHQSEVAYHVADVAIVAIAATLLLTLWGIDLTNVFIGAGAITAIVALTARETLTAILAGFILLFSRPFRVGDWIAVNETSGIVTDVTIFTTQIQTFRDEHVLVPNDEITDSQLTNFSHNEQLRVDVDVGIDYDADVRHARSVAVEAVRSIDDVKPNPDPQVIAKRFDDSAILLEIRVWIGEPTMRRKLEVQTDVIEAIAGAFEREGIAIPYPQRVHSSRDEAGFRVSGPTPDELSMEPIDD